MFLECLNPQDKPYSKHAYRITIGYHSSFNGLVFADCLSDALDIIIDAWQETESENPGYFMSDDELQDIDFLEHDFLSGGNNGRVTSFRNDELFCREYMADDIELLAKIGK